MDRVKLSHIDEELDSSEVAELCFLCLDVVQRKKLEGIDDAKRLFVRLEEKGLMENIYFLSELLRTIHRPDLANFLETDSRQSSVEEMDANPVLSEYRVMLYRIYDEITTEDLQKMKFLLSDQLAKRLLEKSSTALDVFNEMEKTNLMSNTNVLKLYETLQNVDRQLAATVHNYMRGITQQPPHVSIDNQRFNDPTAIQTQFSISETQPIGGRRDSVYNDASGYNPGIPPFDPSEHYTLIHVPRGFCVIINNEKFPDTTLRDRAGTQQDANALNTVFRRLGFEVFVHNNLTSKAIRDTIQELRMKDFSNHDALVVCVLSHGENGCVFGTDEQKVLLHDLTKPFTSGRTPSLAGKPKLFFIQACQGSDYQMGSSLPRSSSPGGEERAVMEERTPRQLEEDSGPVYNIATVPWDADFLIGMATVPEYKSFRHTVTGSIYIQELCRQLTRSAESPVEDDILTVLTRVNREVSKGNYLSYKQMPEPKYTLTKKLILKFV